MKDAGVRRGGAGRSGALPLRPGVGWGNNTQQESERRVCLFIRSSRSRVLCASTPCWGDSGEGGIHNKYVRARVFASVSSPVPFFPSPEC